MLGKILLTLLVMLIAFMVLRQRTQTSQSEGTKPSKKKELNQTNQKPDSESTSDLRVAAYLFLILMFGAAIIIYYQRWQDDHSIVTVSLFRGDQTAATTYQVYKYQLGERTFTTVEGTLITVADSERMEVQGLEQ